jgi:TPP-dependent indolepyruvate ferredoxin oxidoreductase alpha subunit
VLIPNDELDETMSDLAASIRTALERGGSLGLVFEDDPQRNPASCPRLAAMRLGLTVIESADVSQLREGVEHVLRLSRAARAPVGMVVHSSILRSLDTLEAKANRAAHSVEVLMARRRRRARTSRWAESGGVLRMARRMELNAFRAVPNPGERVPVGFVAVGPASEAIGHLASVLGLYSRVPVLQLRLLHPIDQSAMERLLTRCEQVIVLEPRPGVMESSVLAAAESLRRHGGNPAAIWGSLIPPDGSDEPMEMH